jgi:hypothetical protein
MKFQLLPIGARFEYEGKAYVKTGPLTAATEGGGQRMIPRFALLRPLDGAVAETPRRSRNPDDSVAMARVMAALEAFHGECALLLQAVAGDAAREQSARAELDAARQRFLEALE